MEGHSNEFDFKQVKGRDTKDILSKKWFVFLFIEM